MSIGTPFTPTTQATAGNTVKVTASAVPASVAGTVDCTSFPANNIRIFNNGTVTVFARLSRELAASITATNADVPIAAGASLLVMNPNREGKTGVAVLSSTTTACDVYFTPGEGGI